MPAMRRGARQPVRGAASGLAGAVAVALFLAGCSAKPPLCASVQVMLDAASDLNPDATGRASPIVVRVYQLADTEAFGHAGFFDLYDRDRQVLGQSLLARSEATVLPGAEKVVAQPLDSRTRAVAVIAAYRDIEHAQWRRVVYVAGQGSHGIAMDLLRAAIRPDGDGGAAPGTEDSGHAKEGADDGAANAD
ncbi:type VI secretion system lipoprotein TssJ [Bordetella bronchialis]